MEVQNNRKVVGRKNVNNELQYKIEDKRSRVINIVSIVKK